MRTDAPLIRHLFEAFSPQAADLYNKLPLFVMPDEAGELMCHEVDLLASAPESLVLPYDDLILDYPFGTAPFLAPHINAPERGRLWVRVRRGEMLRQDAGTLLDLKHLPAITDGWLFVEGWEERTTYGGLPPAPDHSLIPATGGRFRDFNSYLHWYPAPCEERALGIWCNTDICLRPRTALHAQCSGSELFHATLCRLVVLSLIYLSEGLGGMTTEVTYSPRSPREEKTERLKPWLAERRRTYIIIDPARSGEYGHPSADKPGVKDAHASPVPHARRGHWRRLTPDRRTWVRPAWVGATEWGHEGSMYRIKLRRTA